VSRDVPPRWTSVVLAFHVVLALASSAALWFAPELLLGDTALLPLARFAAALLAAALLAFALVGLGALRSRDRRSTRAALTGALLLDAMLPVVMGFHPAFLDFLEVERGVPWLALPLALIFAAAVPALLARRALG